MHKVRLDELAVKLGATLHGDGSILISGISSLNRAQAGQITFLTDSKHKDKLTCCAASAVIIKAADLPFCKSAALVVDDVYATYAKAASYFDTTPQPAQ